MAQINPQIRFEATLFRSKEAPSGILLALPNDASAKLSSRGLAMVEGTLDGVPFQTVLEPDGKGSHWFQVSEAVLDAAGVDCGDTVSVSVAPTREWLEPTVPEVLKELLMADPQAQAIWTAITPAARWDWIRWMGAARQLETRQRRLESICSRLKNGKRRPCCFDRNQCTLTDA